MPIYNEIKFNFNFIEHNFYLDNSKQVALIFLNMLIEENYIFNEKYFNDIHFNENYQLYSENIENKSILPSHDGHFKRKNSSEQQDLFVIASYLMSSTLMMEELKELDTILTELAKEQAIYDEVTGGLKDFRYGAPYKDHKLFSSYLKRWAKENEFDEELEVIDKMLSTKEFGAILRQGKLFKDTAFRGVVHGEWTHDIQVWCVAQRYKKGKENNEPFLQNHPAKLYRWIGEHPELWFPTFETYYGRGIGNFFVIQDFYNFLLYETANTLPVLHQTIVGRAQKAGKKAKSTFFADQSTRIPNNSMKMSSNQLAVEKPLTNFKLSLMP